MFLSYAEISEIDSVVSTTNFSSRIKERDILNEVRCEMYWLF